MGTCNVCNYSFEACQCRPMTQQSRKESRLDAILVGLELYGSSQGKLGIYPDVARTAILELVRECVPGDEEVGVSPRYQDGETKGWNACKKQMLENIEKL